MEKLDNKSPKPTTSHPQPEVPEPPLSVTHVYTKQYNNTGLQAPYSGPFPVIARPSRTQVKIRVGYTVRGQPKYELRNWKDLKIAHLRPEAEEASRPKRGRPAGPRSPSTNTRPEPSSFSTIQSEAASNTERQQTVEVNKPPDVNKSSSENNNQTDFEPQSGKIQTRSIRSTRNPKPIYIDGLTGPPPLLGFPIHIPNWSHTPWSAAPVEIAELNRRIGA